MVLHTDNHDDHKWLVLELIALVVLAIALPAIGVWAYDQYTSKEQLYPITDANTNEPTISQP